MSTFTEDRAEPVRSLLATRAADLVDRPLNIFPTVAADALGFALAGALMGYPDAAFSGRIKELLSVPELIGHGAAEALARFLTWIGTPASLDDLRSEYIECFDRSALSPLYEGEYGRVRMVSKTGVLADLSAFYQAFGFELEEGDGHETGDHLAVELEFYALLLMKELALSGLGDSAGVDIVRDARRKFVLEHLGGFVRGLALRSEVTRSEPYAAAVGWIAALVEAECALLGVDPPPAIGGGSAADSEEMKCGECALTALTQAK